MARRIGVATAIAVTLALGILIVSSFRAGAPTIDKTTVTSSTRLEFQTEPGEAGAVRALLSNFALAEDLALEDWTEQMPPQNGRPVVLVTLARGDNSWITVLSNAYKENYFFVFVYGTAQNEEFEQIAARLIAELRDRWPNLAAYLGR